jgi:hypothetical protein
MFRRAWLAWAAHLFSEHATLGGCYPATGKLTTVSCASEDRGLDDQLLAKLN